MKKHIHCNVVMIVAEDIFTEHQLSVRSCAGQRSAGVGADGWRMGVNRPASASRPPPPTHSLFPVCEVQIGKSARTARCQECFGAGRPQTYLP